MNKDQTIFSPALAQLENGVYGPEAFQDYLKRYSLRAANTASKISVDALEMLDKSLKVRDTMVFRLGKAMESTFTNFALFHCERKRCEDYFLIDGSDEDCERFTSVATSMQMLPYELLPKLTEGSYVNLAFLSGLMSYALKLDEIESIFPPATCKSTFSFRFKPCSCCTTIFDFNSGQVEIDALFVGKRGNQNFLFVIEAKSNDKMKSLAKHKLLYPVLAVRETSDVPYSIIPVYLKMNIEGNQRIFSIVECAEITQEQEVLAIDDIREIRTVNICLI